MYSEEFQIKLKKTINPYGNGGEEIKIITSILIMLNCIK